MISLMSSRDYGKYKCVAKNPRGQTDGTISVYGKGKLSQKNLTFSADA